MSRFSLSQMLVGVTVLGLIFALVQADGCGRAFTKIHSLAFSPDGKQLAVVKLNWRDANVSLKAYSANLLRTISLVDLPTSQSRVIDREFRPGNQGPATEFLRQGRESLGFRGDGESLFFYEFGGGKIQLFDLKSSKTATFFDPKSPQTVDDFVISQDRTALLATIWNGGVSILAASDGKPSVNNPRLFVFSPFMPGLALSSDNRWAAILDDDKLNLYDANAKLRAGPTFPCSGAFAFGPLASQLAVANTNDLTLLNLGTSGSQSFKFKSEIRNLRFVNKEELVVATEDELVLFSVGNGREKRRLPHHRWVTSLACSPDAQRVAFGDRGGNVVLWDLATGESTWFQVPGASGHPWTLPAAGLAIIAAFYVRAWRRRKRMGKSGTQTQSSRTTFAS